MEEKNKSGQITFGTYAVIVTIVFLVLLVGILAGMLIEKNNEEKGTNATENIVSNTKNEITENVIDNTKENSIDTTNEEDKQNPTNVKGDKLIQFDTEFYDIEDVAKVSKECEKVKKYVDYEYDLDGDGTKDKITMKKTKGEELFYSFELNGKEFLEESAYRLYIVDLNENDNKLEVIVATYGGSDRICYMIFAKQGNKMEELKSVVADGFKTDKKGKFVCPEFSMWITPSVYNEYNFIESGKITTNKLDMNEIKDVDFQLEPKVYYFSKKIDNFKEANLEDLKKSDIERLDKSTKCKIIKFVHDEEYSIDFIYGELSNGNKGYITTARGWFAD